MQAPPQRPPESVHSLRARQARFLSGLGTAAQVVAMVALFVLWKQFNWPLGRALEVCLVTGVTVYTLLMGVASVLLVLEHLRPPALLAAPALRLVSVVIYAVMRYAKQAGVIQSALVLVVLYIAAGILVRRIERRARQRFGW